MSYDRSLVTAGLRVLGFEREGERERESKRSSPSLPLSLFSFVWLMCTCAVHVLYISVYLCGRANF